MITMNSIQVCKTCLSRASPYLITTKRSSSSTIATTTTTTTTTNQPPASRRQLRELSPSDISYYWDTKIPDESQLAYANKFFAPSRHSPVKLWSASKFRTTPLTSLEPEVAFLGRSNVGKSSSLNAIMGKEICWTSSKPGRTREMNAFGIGGTKGGESKIVLLDMPGYGTGSRLDWGREILKYLEGRRQLRRVFVIIDILHGMKDTDHNILTLLRRYGIPHQIILSKIDRILMKKKKHTKTSTVSEASISSLQKTLQDLRPIVQPDGRLEGPGVLGEILTCSAETLVGPGKPLGIDAVRWAILSAAGFDGSVQVNVEPQSFGSTTTTAPGNSTVTS